MTPIIKPLYFIGPLEVSTYFLVLTIGFIVGIFVGIKEAKRVGINQVNYVDLCITIYISALVGARLFTVFFERPDFFFKDFWTHPFDMFKIWQGGLVYYGGFIFAVIASVIFMIKKKMPFFKVADVAVLGLSSGLGIGRIGCFFAGCCYGKPTDWWWGIKYHIVDNVAPQVLYAHRHLEGVPLHPTQILSAMSAFLIFAILFIMRKKKKFDGQLILLMCILYPIARFTIEFLRADERGPALFGILSISQFISLIVFVVSIVIYILKTKDSRPKTTDQEIK